MKTKLENLQRQANDLLTLLTPRLLNDLSQDYQPSIEYDSPSYAAARWADHSDTQICANCGAQLQQRVQR
ncbi:MAG: hypothetical protein SVR81_09830 [Chloroflexota bacterium]|nr:hypothetical protein [Chloroflexota bacterium]